MLDYNDNACSWMTSLECYVDCVCMLISCLHRHFFPSSFETLSVYGISDFNVDPISTDTSHHDLPRDALCLKQVGAYMCALLRQAFRFMIMTTVAKLIGALLVNHIFSVQDEPSPMMSLSLSVLGTTFSIMLLLLSKIILALSFKNSIPFRTGGMGDEPIVTTYPNSFFYLLRTGNMRGYNKVAVANIYNIYVYACLFYTGVCSDFVGSLILKGLDACSFDCSNSALHAFKYSLGTSFVGYWSLLSLCALGAGLYILTGMILSCTMSLCEDDQTGNRPNERTSLTSNQQRVMNASSV